MDLLTHVLISYLLNWRVADFANPGLFILGIICGMFPDFDVFLFPLARRFPWAGHHGITHTLIGGTGMGAVIAALAALGWGLPFVPAVFVAVPTILVHILCDSLTNWAVPLAWPITDRPFKFDIDWAVNPFLMATSSGSILLWWYLHTIAFPLPFFHLVLWTTGLLYFAYFALRAAGKLHLLRRMGRDSMVAPTVNPLHWNVALRRRTGSRCEIMIGEERLLSSCRPKMRHAHFSVAPTAPPLTTKDQVAGYTYNLPEVQRFLRRFRVPLFAVLNRPAEHGPERQGILGRLLRVGGSESPAAGSNEGPGKWRVVWFGAEFLFRRAVLGLLLEVCPDGRYTARTRFYGSLKGELKDGDIDLSHPGQAGIEN